MNAMRRYFSGSIRHKLAVLLSVLTSVPIIIISVLAYQNSAHSIEKEVVSSNLVLTNIAGENVEKQLIQLEDIMLSGLYDSRFIRSLNQMDSGDVTIRYEAQQYLGQKLYALYLASINTVKGIQLHIRSTDKTMTAKDYSISMADNTPETWAFVGDSPPSEQQATAAGSAEFTITAADGSSSYYLHKPIRNFIDNKLVGGITLEIDRRLMETIMQPLRGDDDGRIYLVDADGAVLDRLFAGDASGDAAADPGSMNTASWKPGEAGSFKGEADYIFHYAVEGRSIALVKKLPVKSVLRGAVMTLYYSLITGALFIVLAVAISVVLSRTMTKPIIELVSHMNAVKRDNFAVKVTVDRNDEIGVLQQQFDLMLGRIRTLIEQEMFLVMSQRTSRLKALQAQINPHFLHNTMQMIGGLAVASNNMHIYSIVGALSESFRYIMQTPDRLVTIKEEIKHTQNYLLIQEIRFEGRLDVEWTIDPAVEECLIPPLSIQPLVENAFEHGFSKKKGEWSLKLEAQSAGSELLVRVRDNGVGIAPDKLAAIRESLLSAERFDFSESERIGLVNVHTRMKLFFGDAYGVSIDSVQEQGATVEVRFTSVASNHPDEAGA